jgi:hypothetical protein
MSESKPARTAGATRRVKGRRGERFVGVVFSINGAFMLREKAAPLLDVVDRVPGYIQAMVDGEIGA